MHGNIMNRIREGGFEGYDPKVGDGATYLMWSDRMPYTIIEVRRNKAGKVFQVTVQEDKATRTDKNGQSDCGQTYLFQPNPNGEIRRLSRRKCGRWIIRGGKHGAFLLGERSKYHDYSF